LLSRGRHRRCRHHRIIVVVVVGIVGTGGLELHELIVLTLKVCLLPPSRKTRFFPFIHSTGCTHSLGMID